jgi:hypothetical protein
LEVLELGLELGQRLPLRAQRLHQLLLVAQVRLERALQLSDLNLGPML